MFIPEAHSWNFLSIFEAETNLFDGYKTVFSVCYINVEM